jgi:hypothetical protein
MARIARSPGSRARIAAAVVALILGGMAPAWGQLATGVAGAPQGATQQDNNFFDVVWDSLSGDVYAPGRWKPLPFWTFFSEGWDEPWAGGPNGQGGDGAPRQGWLNAQDGVFYRLALLTFNYAHNVGNGDNWTSALSIYTPFNRRFEVRWDIPLILSNKGNTPEYHVSSPDLQVVPRFALSETENSAQSLDITFRLPTSDVINNQCEAAVTPYYNFWVNPWAGFVARGGAGFGIPFGNQSVNILNARSTFLGNLALGYYFTPHDMAPIGDAVWYVSTNLTQAIDHRGPNTSTLTFTPGFRVHLGANWYGLGGVELPVTQPQPFDYQVLGGLMKVW